MASIQTAGWGVFAVALLATTTSACTIGDAGRDDDDDDDGGRGGWDLGADTGVDADGGNTDGGNTDGGSLDGGDTDGGDTDGGDTDGGDTDGGDTDGGDTDGGDTDGGVADGGDTDGGDADGGDADGGDADGGDTDGGADAGIPTVTSFELEETAESIVGRFTVDDADGDLEGGTVVVLMSDEVREFAIPGDLAAWEPGGSSTVELPLDPCDAGLDWSAELRVVDAAGNASELRPASIRLSGEAIRLTERGDSGTTDLEGLGELGAGTVICGDIDAASTDGTSYTGDLDFFEFSPRETATLTVTLTWEDASGDYNLSLFDAMITTWLGDSSTPGTVQPEAMRLELLASQTYVLRVAGASGGTGAYMVTID